MAFVVPTVGKNTLLRIILNNEGASDLKLKLYSNEVTSADSISDFTECEIDGYAAISLIGSAWSFTNATATYATQTFTFTGAGTVRGAYYTDSTGTDLLWYETFEEVLNVGSPGGELEIDPIFALE